MFGKVFGKRSSGAPAPAKPLLPRPPTDADGVTRVIPKKMWEGPEGEILRKVGFSPDDDSNVVKTSEQFQARFDALREQEKAFVAKCNQKLPYEVAPFALIPYPCWQGEHASFLLHNLEMYPVGPWNTVLLALEEEGALVLGVPKHPRGFDPSVVQGANKLIGEIEQEVSSKHRDAFERAQRGDNQGIYGFGEVMEKARNDLCRVASFIGAELFGAEAMNRNRSMFFGAK